MAHFLVEAEGKKFLKDDSTPKTFPNRAVLPVYVIVVTLR